MTLIQHTTGSYSQCNKARKGSKGVQLGKGELKSSVFIDDIIVYVEKSKQIYKKNLLELINEFSKVTGYKINTEK